MYVCICAFVLVRCISSHQRLKDEEHYRRCHLHEEDDEHDDEELGEKWRNVPFCLDLWLNFGSETFTAALSEHI